MTNDRLLRIAKNAFPFNEGIEEIVKSLWEEPGKKFYIPEHHLMNSNYNLLFFNYKDFGFEYIEGFVRCTGIEMAFNHPDFRTLSVNTFYDPIKRKLYNTCLLIPNYQEFHFNGKHSISQQANTVRNDKDFKKYIQKVRMKFPLEKPD